MTDILYIF